MRIFTFLLLLISFAAKAQVCSGPGRVPETAIPVCGSLTFHQPDVPSCTGPALPYTDCFAQALSDNSVWYKFHCITAGTLGFTIAPASSSDDYDWHLADVTGHAPQDVFTNNLLVSLNLSANAPNTGCSAAGTTNVNCEGNTNPFNEMPLLIAGHDYLLCVTNWSNSGLGYDLSFSGGTAVLTDLLPPSVTSVGVVGCNTSVVKVIFSEDILCSSLTAAGTEFTITNGVHVINSVSSVCAGTTFTMTELSINLQAPLLPGNYQLVVNNGTDLNTLQDVCQDIIPAGTSYPFTVPAQNVLAISNVTYSGCAPTVLKLALSTPVLCNSISANGAEFSLSPGSPVITASQFSCSSTGGYTDTIKVILQSPLPYGNYTLTVNLGSDGNTLIDTCGASIVAGYQFPFVINQVTTAPIVQTIVFDECEPGRLVVNFDKPIACNSLSGTEFSITPGTINVTAATSTCTSANGSVSQVTLLLSGDMPAGNFNLNINNGADANTLSDTCFAFMPVNYTKPFITTQSPAPIYDSLQFDKCTPSDIKIFYSKAIDCGSVNASGLEFNITGPSTVNIASVSGDPAHCSTGYSNWLILHLTQPITATGTYTLHNLLGTDGNSVMDTCHAVQNILETISFNVLGKPTAAFTDQVLWGCVEDTIVLSHPGGSSINSWTWNFSDGTTASGSATTHTFPVNTDTARVELIVSNGVCSDTLKRKYPLGNAINAAFTTSIDSVCVNSNVTFTNNSTGNNLQYQWLFGDNSQSPAQIPPAHAYSLSDSFNISLIITNDHGCSDTAQKPVIVIKKPVVEFTGLSGQYCTGDTVRLNATLLGYISSYAWNTGAGVNFQNQPAISYPYNLQGNYTVSLSATDRFCGTASKDSTTKVYKVPLFDLGIDKKLCPGITVQIGPDRVPGYAYLWSNAATEPKIITVTQSNTYHLTVDNNGCVAEDAIFVEVLDNCLIKVPGAFTPNRDGLNDRLKAINADLATNFSLKVYNRFGQLLFATNDPLDGWDGTFKGNPADTGTYVWQLSYIDPFSKKPVYEKGTSILIR